MKSSWTPPCEGPIFERPRHELRTVIDGDRPRRRADDERAVQGGSDRPPGHARGGLKNRTLATPLIDDGEHTKRPSIGQCVVDEVHAPALGGACRRRRRAAMQGDVLPPTHPHPKLQAVQPIQPPHALPIHRPAFAAEQHPAPREAEPWARMRQLPNA